MNIIDYNIISDNMPTGLKDKVNIEIKNGWQPLGGAVQMPASVYQTMVKYAESRYIASSDMMIRAEMLESLKSERPVIKSSEEPKPKKKGIMKRIFKGDKDGAN